ncbi:MAG: OmpA family protein [Myxococcales bacterium]|nr:OmpA family protein [Myxococcales bacterium]
MRERLPLPTLAVLLVISGATRARADGVQVEQFEPVPGSSGLLNVRTPDLLPSGGLTLSLYGSLASSPLRLTPTLAGDPRDAGDVIDSSLRFEVGGAYGLLDGLELSAALPVAFSLGEGDFSVGGLSPADRAEAGLGDIRLGVIADPMRLFRGRPLAEHFRLAAAAITWMPTGSEARLEGEGNVRVEPRLLAEAHAGPWRAAFDLGYHLRPETTLFTLVNGDQLRWRLGLQAPLGVEGLVAQASVFGSHHLAEQPLTNDVQQLESTTDYDPIEGLLAAAWRLPGGFRVLLGGGAALKDGVGAPRWRVVLGLAFARPNEAWASYGVDHDHDDDGIDDDFDLCPFEPENRDGIRDDDGCPEQPLPALKPWQAAGPPTDADGDRIPDELDLCPSDPEDFDGFLDTDGCPEADDDGDGLADAQDHCPRVAETLDGFKDDDGCPEVGPDTDGDGIGDFQELCPNEPESRNGVRDFDGCPEVIPAAAAPTGYAPLAEGPAPLPPLPQSRDTDGDGLPDVDDLCPTAAEDLDGYADGDGCPDDDDDGDGVADAADACPRVAGDAPDGCPKVGPDADGDGIGDADDDCPLEPETIDGVRDADGCPELVAEADLHIASPTLVLPALVPDGDPDHDGLSGEDDLCPTEAEDADGFQDGDGCPEADDDGDGLPDVRDRCRLVAETSNFYDDDDGCPDLAPAAVAGIIGAVESIQFKVGRSDLRPIALPTLKRVAAAMKRYPRMRLQIDGHTDSTGTRERNYELSNDRAASVRAWLIAQGVHQSRLSSFGYGPDRPIADNRDLKGRYLNRRVELRYAEARPGVEP